VWQSVLSSDWLSLLVSSYPFICMSHACLETSSCDLSCVGHELCQAFIIFMSCGRHMLSALHAVFLLGELFTIFSSEYFTSVSLELLSYHSGSLFIFLFLMFGTLKLRVLFSLFSLVSLLNLNCFQLVYVVILTTGLKVKLLATGPHKVLVKWRIHWNHLPWRNWHCLDFWFRL